MTVYKRTRSCIALVSAVLIFSTTYPHARALQIEPLNLLHASQFIKIDRLATLGGGSTLNAPMQALEVSCFATGLYHEARGESQEGQLAVAQVILNRMKSAAYPDTACGVIYQNAHMRNRCQFSFACDRRSDDIKETKIYADLKEIATQTLRLGHAPFSKKTSSAKLQDKVQEATHYHTTAVSPSWGRKIERVAKIGAHIFYRSERVAKSL